MSIWELLVLGIGLSMDAFAVSICKGLSTKKATLKQMGSCGMWFGGFQALMPLIGFLVGSLFAKAIESVDHWVAFVLLALIGFNMLKEALSKEEEQNDKNADFSVKTMFTMAVATSIDALAVGVSFAFLDVNIWVSVLVIGLVTLLLSASGIYLGRIFGSRLGDKAGIVGGVVLIAIGIKILVEHLNFF